MVEEYAQVNQEIFIEVLEPTVINPRFTLGKTGTTSPYELNSAMAFITTSWFVNTTPYDKSIEMFDDMAELKGSMVLGSENPNCFPCIEIYLKKCGELVNTRCLFYI